MKKKIIGAALLASIALGQRVPLFASDKSDDLPALKAKKTELENDLVALRAQDQSDATVAEQLLNKQSELDAVETKIEAAELKARNATLEAAVLNQRTKDADDAVKAAVKRGAIPVKDEALQAKWKTRCIEDPENLELLASMKGSPALDRGATPQRLVLGNVQVTREDVATVLQAYHAEKDPRKRGALYAREIAPALNKGEVIDFTRVKLQAANTLGTLVGNIISQRTLELVVTRRPLLSGIVTDFSNEVAKLNQTVYTRAVGLPTVQNFGAAASDTADTDYPVVLNQHKQVAFTFTAAEYLATGRNLVAEHSEALALALGNFYVDTVAALITDAFTSEVVAAAAGKSFDDVVAATKALNAAGAPDINRFAWVNSDYAAALRNDELMIANFDKNNESGYAHWKNVQGFKDIWEYPALPGNTVNLIGFYFHRSALLLAARVAMDPQTLTGAGYPGLIETVTDPVSGLSVISNQYIAQDTLAVTSRLISLFGCARGLVTSGHKNVSS